MKENIEHLRLQFHLEGSRNQATVHVDMVKNKGSFDFNYIVAEMDSYPRLSVTVEDNRSTFEQAQSVE